MSFKPFIRKDSIKRDDKPRVSLRKDKIRFNSAFVKKENLLDYKFVKYYIDEINFGIGFEFLKEGDKHSYKLFSDASKNNLTSSTRQLINTNKWIKNVAYLNSSLDTQFNVEWDNRHKIWIIHLCPSFENKVSRNSNIIDIRGIYRYQLEDEIVYIGKGVIKSRLNSPERKNWKFDTIEYSIILNNENQAKWESYWLDRFVEDNGRMPIYNKIKAPKD